MVCLSLFTNMDQVQVLSAWSMSFSPNGFKQPFMFMIHLKMFSALLRYNWQIIVYIYGVQNNDNMFTM